MNEQMNACRLCPRACGVNRTAGKTGACGMTSVLTVSRWALHLWEEPPISGTKGSGTIFFTGCPLGCVFCQNRAISHENNGRSVTSEALEDMMLSLQAEGAHNINLVTPTHYTSALVPILERLKPRLHIPVVWNSSGYESRDSLAMLDGLVDIYLPDFKYVSSELSAAYSAAPDYARVATAAVQEMYRQVGVATFDHHGIMQKGMILRHLILPGCRKDSIAVVQCLAAILPVNNVKLSLMRQYTPDFALDCPHKNLHRRLTDFEYRSVVDEALRLGFDGYIQGKDAATAAFTPDFSQA